MQDTMDRFKFRKLILWEVFEKHFEIRSLKKRVPRMENHTLTNANPQKFIEFIG